MSPLDTKHLSPEQQRRRLELVLEGTRLGMWDWNPQTGEVAFDERWAEMLGYALEEIEPHVDEWKDRVHPEDLEKCFEDINAHIEGRVPFYENVHRMRHRDGRWLYILDRGKIVERDEEGRPTRFTGTHTDITEQKEAEQAALAASRAKSLFLAVMSHEIRTPLNGVLGTVQLLESTPLTAEQREYLEVIRSSGEGLLRVINDILDLTRIESGQIELSLRPAAPRDVLSSAFELYRESALEKHLDYELKIDPSVPSCLLMDDIRVKQVVMNLLSNAVKFTHRGRVELCAEAEPGVEVEGVPQFTLRIRVSDSGKGIHDQTRIWERFRQEDASVSREFGGTGLGLSICRDLIEMMDGSIGVESEPDHGSSFTIEIPLPLGEMKSVPPSSDLEEPVPFRRVLVAEDNAVNQLVIGRMLERLGLKVTMASNGVEAVEAVRSAEHDVVFMDLHMPQLDGFEATRRLRAGGCETPIYALSADALPGPRAEALESGMNGFLSKPFDFAEVRQVLRDLGAPRDGSAEGS